MVGAEAFSSTEMSVLLNSWTGDHAGRSRNKRLGVSIVFLNSGLALNCSEFVD
jgi:hypothetical protein